VVYLTAIGAFLSAALNVLNCDETTKDLLSRMTRSIFVLRTVFEQASVNDDLKIHIIALYADWLVYSFTFKQGQLRKTKHKRRGRRRRRE